MREAYHYCDGMATMEQIVNQGDLKAEMVKQISNCDQKARWAWKRKETKRCYKNKDKWWGYIDKMRHTQQCIKRTHSGGKVKVNGSWSDKMLDSEWAQYCNGSHRGVKSCCQFVLSLRYYETERIKAREREMTKWDGGGVLMEQTNLPEDVIGEIMSYL